jgi:hypothetical protein
LFNSQIAVLPYNPYFEEEVKKVRKKYGIPGDSTKAEDWFKKLLLKYRKSTFVFLFNHISGRYFPYHLAVFELDLEEDFKHVLAEGAG